jgi:hypothetical protein
MTVRKPNNALATPIAPKLSGPRALAKYRTVTSPIAREANSPPASHPAFRATRSKRESTADGSLELSSDAIAHRTRPTTPSGLGSLFIYGIEFDLLLAG